MVSNVISVTDSMLDSLRKTRPWTLFLAILGFVFTGLGMLFGLFMILAGGFAGDLPHQPGTPQFFGTAFGFGFGILYLIMSVFLYLLPCIILFRYGSAIGRIAGNDSQTAMEEALLRQKTFWKYIGILMIIVLALYVLLIIGGIVVAIVVGVHAAHA